MKVYSKTLSVSMVTFNRWPLTMQTLMSIDATVPSDWEIEWLIVDNKSTDETVEELPKLLESLRGHVGLCEMLPEQMKQTQAVNISMNVVQGEYLLRVDNDIHFTDGWFEDCFKIVNEFKDLGFVCPTHHLKENTPDYKGTKIMQSNGASIDMMSEFGINVPGNLFMKSSIAKDIGGFYTPYNLLHADVHYCMIAKHMGYKWGYTWDTQCNHIGLPDGKTEYSQKAINERQSENKRYELIAKGDLKDKHPQEIEFFQQMKSMLSNRGKQLPYHKDINVLIPSSGRRVELVEMFKEVFSIPRWDGHVYTCGIDNFMSSAFSSDGHFVVPSIFDPGYIDAMIKLCKEKNIAYIFPVIDYDVKVLTDNALKFLNQCGTEIVGPTKENAYKCFDKLETAKFFKELDVPHPETQSGKVVITNDGKYITKPKFGFASKSLSVDEYKAGQEVVIEDHMIMQSFASGTEYTMDLVSDRRFNIVSLVARERMSVRGGEILTGKIVNHLHLFNYILKISHKLEITGPWCIQYIINDAGEVSFIEINTRFGGGAPMSKRAGQNQALTSLKVLERDFFGYHYRYLVQWGLTGMRYDRCVYKTIDGEKKDHDGNGTQRLKG